MKKIFLLSILVMQLCANFETKILTIDNSSNSLTIKAKNLKKGMSGFIVHNISKEHSIILNSVKVSNYNAKTDIATLKIEKFTTLNSNSVPKPIYLPTTKDKVVLAYAYNRALLIAPNEEIYYKIKKNIKINWISSDIFASFLSANGHPTPLREDFEKFIVTMRIGLIFIYLDKKLYTLDAKSFKVLNTTKLDLDEKNIKLPFYSRIEKIEANWFGDGSNELKEYSPYYNSLILK